MPHIVASQRREPVSGLSRLTLSGIYGTIVFQLIFDLPMRKPGVNYADIRCGTPGTGSV